jgi:hypothetical protein
MTNNINVNPYYDDFDEFKNFHQILFKPGFAVQARELTQLQTILRNQIEKFGNHIFKQGSVVIPGNSFSDLAVPFIKVQSQFNSVDINIEQFLGKKIIGDTTGVTAIVTKVVDSDFIDPVTFYITYMSGSETGEVTFENGEEIYLDEDNNVRALLNNSDAIGVGSLAFVNRGVYYVNGTFVSIEGQSTILSKYDSIPSCHVLLKITESIVTPDQDTTLLDPAFGAYNYLAPGADRIKISLELTTLPIDSIIDSDYVELMRFRNGVLEEHFKTPRYNELDKVLAQRVFDESGNYVIDGFESNVREHLKVSNNGGVYPDGNNDLLVVEVSSGKASVQGFSVEKLASTRIDIEKARTDDHINQTELALRPDYGQYIIVSDFDGGTFSIRNRETANLYNSSDTTSGAIVGTAKIIGVDYLPTDLAGADALYKLWITDLSFIEANTINDVGGLTFDSGNGTAYVLGKYNLSGQFQEDEIILNTSSGRKATVKYVQPSTSTVYAHKHTAGNSAPRIGDSVEGSVSNVIGTVNGVTSIFGEGQSGLIFKLPVNIPKALKDESDSLNLSYTTQRELTINTDGSGDGSVSVSSGVIQPIEVGTFVALSSTGIVDINLFNLNIPGSTLTLTGGPASDTVKAYVTILNTNVAPKTKTVTTVTDTFVTPSSSYTLTKTDAFELVSIEDDVLGNITPNFQLLSGQTDYAYTNSRIVLKSGRPLPQGEITVQYKHFAHSTSGDFFSIDSYSSVPNFLETNYRYSSDSTGEVFNLAGCIDFRPSVGDDGTFTGSGSRRNDLVVHGTLFSSSLQYYMPRIDSLLVDADGNLTVKSGIPADRPYPPAIPEKQFELYRYYIPEYTISSEDVSIKRLDIDRFTMKDIHDIQNRVERVEKFVLLTSEESKLFNSEIIDPETGLSRFKTGYLVETFENPLTIADTLNSKFASTFISDTLQANHEQLNCKLKLVSEPAGVADGLVNRNGYLMLPYDEVKFASQILSSRTTNLNPFLTFKWDGKLDVVPPADTWVEVFDEPEILKEKSETVYVNVCVPPPPPPPPPEFRPPPVVNDPPPEPFVLLVYPVSSTEFGVSKSRSIKENPFTTTYSFQSGTQAINQIFQLEIFIQCVSGSGSYTIQETSRPSSGVEVRVDGVSSNSGTARKTETLSSGQTRTHFLRVIPKTTGTGSGTFRIVAPEIRVLTGVSGGSRDGTISWTGTVTP